MVNSVYYLTNFLFFDIALLYYYINLWSSIICCLFSDIMCLSWYLPIKSNIFSLIFTCPWTIMWWISWDFCKFISIFCQLNHQLLQPFFELLFNSNLKCICCKLFWRDQTVFNCVNHLRFYWYFYQHFCSYF